jgi:hypothetical protein
VRGVTLFRLGALLAALLLLPPLVRGAMPGVAAALIATAALAAGAAGRNRWWVLRIHRDQLEDALTRSCRMVLATPAVAADGVRVRLPKAQLVIRVRALGRRAFELRFRGPWHAHRKATLLRAVIAKQFETPLPRLRIRFRTR